MRTVVASGIGVLIGAAAAGLVFVAIDREDPPRVDEPIAKTAPAALAAPGPAVRTILGGDVPKPAQARPTTPDYGPRAAAPPVIYRCRSKAGTSYSNEPCPGGSIVEESSAVSGYVSRPSDRMARLVAEGRAAADVPRTPAYRAPVPSASETRDCATMRRQIRDLDAEALRPQDLESLDDLRGKRRDIRTSMARQHC